MTVLFTDIRDFTTISEQHSPEAVVDMLSAYFQAMNVVVQRHNGVIVQYLGDSIYAMWNAPAENPDHVDDGCRCTLALKAAIDALTRRTRRPGGPNSSPASGSTPALPSSAASARRSDGNTRRWATR